MTCRCSKSTLRIRAEAGLILPFALYGQLTKRSLQRSDVVLEGIDWSRIRVFCPRHGTRPFGMPTPKKRRLPHDWKAWFKDNPRKTARWHGDALGKDPKMVRRAAIAHGVKLAPDPRKAPEYLRVLGKMSDREVARRYGRCPSTVSACRRLHGIKEYKG